MATTLFKVLLAQIPYLVVEATISCMAAKVRIGYSVVMEQIRYPTLALTLE